MYRLFICLRYLRRRRTAALAVLAVTFGVATLLTVLSIMEGYIGRLREMIRGQEAHMVLRSPYALGLCDTERIEAALRSVPHVAGTAPSIVALAMYRSDGFSPCLLRSIDPAKEIGVTGIGTYFLRPGELEEILRPLAASPGEADSLAAAAARKDAVEAAARRLQSRAGRRPLAAGEIEELFSLARRRAVLERLPEAIQRRILHGRRRPPSAIVVGMPFLAGRDLSLGQVIKIMTVRPGTSELVQGTFIVTGAFKTGNFDIDSRLFFMHNRRMTTFLRAFDPRTGEPCFQVVRIALDDYRHAPEVRRQIERRLQALPPESGAPDSIVQTWEDQQRNFLKAVRIEKWIMGFVLSLLNIFTGCIILLMLVLLVIEKTRDAGILLSMGATPGGVLSIFLLNGLFITIIGTVLGLAGGALFVDNINAVHDWIHDLTGYQLFDPEVYLMDRIPVELTVVDALVSAVPAVIFGLLASLVPALWAARQDPIKAIHYE